MGKELEEETKAVVASNFVLKEHTSQKRHKLTELSNFLELVLEFGKLGLYQSIETMFIVAQVDDFEANNDDDDASKVSLAQVRRLSHPHHEEADKYQAVKHIILLLDHEIGGICNDIAHYDNADESRVDDALRSKVTLLNLRVDQLEVVLPLAP